jgi:hypothetical protein
MARARAAGARKHCSQRRAAASVTQRQGHNLAKGDLNKPCDSLDNDAPSKLPLQGRDRGPVPAPLLPPHEKIACQTCPSRVNRRWTSSDLASTGSPVVYEPQFLTGDPLDPKTPGRSR